MVNMTVVIKYNGHKIKSYPYCLKGIRASRLESTEPRVLKPKDAREAPKVDDRMILVRETGPNNRRMRKYQSKFIKASDLEDRPSPSAPEPIAKDFAYVDGLVAKESDDPDMLFNDPIWIIGANDSPSIEDLLAEDNFIVAMPDIDQLVFHAVNLRTKQSFTFTPRELKDFCWVPYGMYRRDGGYYTRVGGQYQKKRNGKFKSLNIVQKRDDPNDTFVAQFSVDNRLKDLEVLSDSARDEFVLHRLEIQRRFARQVEPGIWIPSLPDELQPYNHDEINAVRETTRPFIARGPRKKFGELCNLKSRCPALKIVDGKLERVKAFFGQLPTADQLHPEHYHLEDSDCPVTRDGGSHKIHCVFRTRQDRRCIVSVNFLHSCCDPPQLSEVQIQDTVRTAGSPRWPDIPIHDKPVDVAPRDIQQRDLADQVAARQYQVQQATAQVSYLLTEVSSLRNDVMTNKLIVSELQKQRQASQPSWQHTSGTGASTSAVAPLPVTAPVGSAGHLFSSQLMPPPPPPYYQNNMLGHSLGSAPAPIYPASLIEDYSTYTDTGVRAVDVSITHGLPIVFTTTPANTPQLSPPSTMPSTVPEGCISPAAVAYEDNSFTEFYPTWDMTR